MSKLAMTWNTTMFMSKIAVGLEHVRLKPQNVAGYEVHDQKRCMHLNAACVFISRYDARASSFETRPARAAANAFIYIHKQTHVP